MVKEFLDGYKAEVSKIKHDPVNRDFSVNGPYEDAMISGLFKVYVTMAGLEILLKGVFMFSNFGAERIFDHLGLRQTWLCRQVYLETILI